MNLAIEKWVSNSKFSDTAKTLFIESATCYKAGAYRASLLLSYLGFLTLLKERILRSKKPNLFPQGEWDILIKKLQNEDTWEAVVFDTSQQQEKIDNNKVKIKDAIFSINDSLRNQIKYWKDRRNDCAHNKDNLINSSHVEVFWAFLESNYPKITIEGGLNSFLLKLSRHYDRTYTPSGKDVTPLVQEIEYSVRAEELPLFWEQALSTIDNMYEYWLDSSVLNFTEKVFLNTSEMIRKSLLTYLKTKENVLFDLLSHKPSYFLFLDYNEQEVRNFWTTKIYRTKNCLGIYACLLRNNLIPSSEVDEANELIFDKIKYYTESQEDHIILANNGFGNTIHQKAFEEDRFSKFMWVNEKADLLNDYIAYYPLTPLVVEKMCIEYNKDNYYSYWLLERVEKLFTENPYKRSEFIQIANANNFTLPKQIIALNT